VIPGVGDGDEASILRYGHVPRPGKLSCPVSFGSECDEKLSSGCFKCLDPVIVLVHDEKPVLSGVVGSSSGSVELSWSAPKSSKLELVLSIRSKHKDDMVVAISDVNVVGPGVGGESPWLPLEQLRVLDVLLVKWMVALVLWSNPFHVHGHDGSFD